MIRLVTFDLDDTLWDLSGVIERATEAMNGWLAGRAPGYAAVPRAEVDALYRDLVQNDPALAHDVSARRLAVLRGTLERAGEPPARAAALATGAFAEFLDWRHRVVLYPNALAVLAALRERYTLAALTNGNADYRRLGLGSYFAFGYSAAEVGASKPAAAMFNRALAHAGVAAAEAVHVGDHPVNDVQGAADAGLATVWMDMRQTGQETAATATVASLTDLPAALAAINAEGAGDKSGRKRDVPLPK